MIVSFPLSGPLYNQPAFVMVCDTEALEYVLLMLSWKQYTTLVIRMVCLLVETYVDTHF